MKKMMENYALQLLVHFLLTKNIKKKKNMIRDIVRIFLFNFHKLQRINKTCLLYIELSSNATLDKSKCVINEVSLVM